MKKSTVSMLILFTISTGLNAQTFVEKLAAKKAEMEAKMKASTSNGSSSKSHALDPNVSQSDIALKWADKEYEKFMPNERTAEAKKVKIRIDNVKGQVNSIWVNDIEYRADEYGKSNFVRYYKATGSGHYKVVFTDNQIIFFTTNVREDQYTQKHYLNKPGDFNKVREARAYIEASKVNQQADLELYAANAKANSDKAFEEKKAKLSIEGKKVSKIEVTDIKAQYGFGYYRPFSFQIKATLADGRTISTKDGGFWEDYTITYLNGDVKSKTIEDTQFITGDKIVIEVKSKFDEKIIATGDVIMNYSETLTMNFNSNNWGKSGSSLKIEAKQRKHAVTGKDVIMIKVTDLSGYAKPKYMIIDADQSLNVYTKGHNGYKTVGTGNETGPGQNAGNGGNITVYKDPSVTNFNIEYTMNGGIGGAGTYGYNRGRDGRDGVYKEEVRAVNF